MSKWESGKGYPNIESLKCISKIFSVSIDELLSGEELISLAETENRSNLGKTYSLILGILDLTGIAFILLPLYGKLEGAYIYAVNLLSFSDTTKVNLFIYWAVFIAMIGLGITGLLLTHFEKERWVSFITKCSLLLESAAICFFAAARESYVTTLLFLIFLMKIVILVKQEKTK